jgi:hypothetical protein
MKLSIDSTLQKWKANGRFQAPKFRRKKQGQVLPEEERVGKQGQETSIEELKPMASMAGEYERERV